MEFLKNNFGKYPFFRKSWEPWIKAKHHGGQKSLGEF
jgi:hypothetical protein